MIVRICKQKESLGRSGIAPVRPDPSGQPLLAQLIVCLVKELQIVIEQGVRLLGPECRRDIEDINEESE